MKLIYFFLPLIVLLSRPINGQSARMSNGAPSDSYWQQRTDYRLQAELDLRNNILSGSGTVTYYNNSPDTLNTLVWHLYQNIFRKDSSPRKNNQQSSRVFSVTEGMTVRRLSINGAPLTLFVDETIMETPLPVPLLPRSSVTIEVSWLYDIPNNPALRTGRRGNDVGLCQWYPQIAVYDDRRGWDRTQYRGIAEFYTEYGDWNVELTVPRNFIVASTGMLINPQEVLSATQLGRFRSVGSGSVTKIITPEEIKEKDKTVSAEKYVWKFSAENVRDFAMAVSPNFVWDGTMTSDSVLIYAFYHPNLYRASVPLLIDDAPNWDRAAMTAKETMEFFSERFGRYVYPQATIVSGPVTGMEYPMMVFAESGNAILNTLEYTIVHELGHQWYPMMIGSNETSFPFMDEGFCTYITNAATEHRHGSDVFLSEAIRKKFSWMNLPETGSRLFYQRMYLNTARANNEATLMTHPYNITYAQFGSMAYNKPGAVMVMLEDLLGSETFLRGMNEYYSRWLFKHPYPEDFFNTMEDAAGIDLGWFWNQWFNQTWKLDLAVDDVINTESNGVRRSVIVIVSKEEAVMPASLRLTLADGSVRGIRFSRDVWSKGNRAEIQVDSLPAAIANVVIDPEMKLTDVNRLNNSWSCPPVVFDYGFNIANYFSYPIDAYRINAAPAAGFNLRDGFELGTTVSGSYMITDHAVSLFTNYGTRSGIPDYEASYSTPLRWWDPQLTTSARLFRLDGFSGWQWNIEKTFDQRKKKLQNDMRSFVINTSILSIRVNDDRYLAGPAEWDRTGILDAGFISLKYYDNYSWGKLFIRLDDEFGTPTSSFSYSKLTSEMKVQHSFFGMNVDWRLFGGSSAGNVPSQTAHSLTRATRLEEFDSKFFRTPIVGSSLREHVVLSGGGNLFLQRDTTALNVAALNVALSAGPLVLFADAGTLWDSSATRFKQFFYDAGAGVQFGIPEMSAFGYRTKPFGVGFYFPIFIKDPSRPDDKEVDFRWRIVFGVRL